ncbi:hypothetical protein EAF04_001411 [Stromatinia cepivora]|nr:hypothetical protein EAF04_001411 [Stromatinia cepivora]
MGAPVPEVVDVSEVPEISEAIDTLDCAIRRLDTSLSEFRLDIASQVAWHQNMEARLMKLIHQSDELLYQAEMWMQRQRSAKVEDAGKPLKAPVKESTSPSLPTVSAAISSLLSSTTSSTTEVSGRTWILFYSDTVYKRDNSLRTEWKTKERYEAWLRRNGWIAITEEEIETLKRWKGWALALLGGGEEEDDWEEEKEDEEVWA